MAAVEPIALNMVSSIANDPETADLPISGIGGIATWRDAPEFLAAWRDQRARVNSGWLSGSTSI